MPSGQGKTAKGIVLSKLLVWQQRQSKVDEIKQLYAKGCSIKRLLLRKRQRSWQDYNFKMMSCKVDGQGLIIANRMSIASELQKSWEVFEIGKKLEQALKGGGDE
jgi:hypothetical protein